MILVYGLKNCDTCRKALKELSAAGLEAELIDIREKPMPDGLLEQAFDQFGEALVNTRSTTWRGLDDNARAGEPLALLATYPALMKRPLIDSGDALYLGWKADTKAAVIV